LRHFFFSQVPASCHGKEQGFLRIQYCPSLVVSVSTRTVLMLYQMRYLYSISTASDQLLIQYRYRFKPAVEGPYSMESQDATPS
jgi:hypothetical protein